MEYHFRDREPVEILPCATHGPPCWRIVESKYCEAYEREVVPTGERLPNGTAIVGYCLAES